MVQPIKDSFLDLEHHRQLLEENTEKLRKSLLHWQLWAAEYEGLKEEIIAAGPEKFTAICNEYEGTLVTKKEIDDLLGVKTKTTRTRPQVVNLLDRRIDYVEQNVQTVTKQLEAAENKLMAATVISEPDVRNDEGLPLMDIVEELDDEGNVISSHVSTPGSVKPQLLEVLEKAGVKNLPGTSAISNSPEPGDQISSETPKPVTSTTNPSSHDPASKKLLSPSPTPEPKDALRTSKQTHKDPPPNSSNSTKKAVKFAEDTKPGPAVEKSHTAKRVEQIMELAKRSSAPPSEAPVIPTDESPEDSALRREMLQYGMSEVGAVVAELQLEEGSDWSEEEYEDDEDMSNMSSIDDEDEHGRSTGKVMNDELRKHMMELEQRLGVKMMQNIGKNASDGYDIVQEGIGQIKVIGSEEAPVAVKSENVGDSEPQKSSRTSSAKKGVRFAEELDISPSPKPTIDPPTNQSTIQRQTVAPVSDIVERTAPAKSSPAPQYKKKSSRFKSARHGSDEASTEILNTPNTFSTSVKFSPAVDTTRIVPTGPEGAILAPAVVERDVPLDTSPHEPDEMDPKLVHQEVATEYHKMRNRMIQRQGGFLKEEESEFVPFTEEEGGPKKMSRFKAARLARS